MWIKISPLICIGKSNYCFSVITTISLTPASTNQGTQRTEHIRFLFSNSRVNVKMSANTAEWSQKMSDNYHDHRHTSVRDTFSYNRCLIQSWAPTSSKLHAQFPPRLRMEYRCNIQIYTLVKRGVLPSRILGRWTCCEGCNLYSIRTTLIRSIFMLNLNVNPERARLLITATRNNRGQQNITDYYRKL